MPIGLPTDWLTFPAAQRYDGMLKKLILIGGGGHCRSCIDVIESTGKYEIFGIIDRPVRNMSDVLGYPIIGTDDDLPALVKAGHSFLVTIGHIESPEIRVKLFETLQQLNAKIVTVISPRAYVSRFASIGRGTIIMHNAFVNAGATVGKNCIINTNSLIEHDVSIGDHNHISTGAIINGGVRIGPKCFLGSGCVAKEYSVIDNNSFVKALTLVGQKK